VCASDNLLQGQLFCSDGRYACFVCLSPALYALFFFSLSPLFFFYIIFTVLKSHQKEEARKRCCAGRRCGASPPSR
jgi:hypothetical protein